MMKIRLDKYWKYWRWYQYFTENMKSNFGNMGLVSSNKNIDGQCWKGQKHNNENCFGGTKAIFNLGRSEKNWKCDGRIWINIWNPERLRTYVNPSKLKLVQTSFVNFGYVWMDGEILGQFGRSVFGWVWNLGILGKLIFVNLWDVETWWYPLKTNQTTMAMIICWLASPLVPLAFFG